MHLLADYRKLGFVFAPYASQLNSLHHSLWKIYRCAVFLSQLHIDIGDTEGHDSVLAII